MLYVETSSFNNSIMECLDDPDIDPESYVEISEVAKQVLDTHSDAFEMLK